MKGAQQKRCVLDSFRKKLQIFMKKKGHSVCFTIYSTTFHSLNLPIHVFFFHLIPVFISLQENQPFTVVHVFVWNGNTSGPMGGRHLKTDVGCAQGVSLSPLITSCLSPVLPVSGGPILQPAILLHRDYLCIKNSRRALSLFKDKLLKNNDVRNLIYF